MPKASTIALLVLVVPLTFVNPTTENCLYTGSNSNVKDDMSMEKIRHDIELLNNSNEILRSQLSLLINNARDLADNCVDATKETNASGIYKIELKNFNRQPFYVSCNTELEDGGWLVVLRRQDGSIDFDKTWDEYKNGFGNLKNEFFIGLDKLHDLTKNSKQELLIVMEDYAEVHRYAIYDAFEIEAEADGYAMSVLGKYSGDAGDSLTNHTGFLFTTKDKHHDLSEKNCAKTYTGGWWYSFCHLSRNPKIFEVPGFRGQCERNIKMIVDFEYEANEFFCSHLTGKYYNDERSKRYYAQGITWHTFRGYQKSMKYVEMMIRPRKEKPAYKYLGKNPTSIVT